MKTFVVTADQLVRMEYGDIKQRVSVADEVRKNEIKPALLGLKEPLVFNPVN